MDFKNEVVDLVSSQVDLPKEKIAALIERPKNAKMGDYAFPAFILAKTMHKNPAIIAKDIAENLSSDDFASIQAVGPYVNFAIDHEKLVSSTFPKIFFKSIYAVILDVKFSPSLSPVKLLTSIPSVLKRFITIFFVTFFFSLNNFSIINFLTKKLCLIM